jgi:hypothetical protein
MGAIRRSEVPPSSLLARYLRSGAYVDCYATEVPLVATHTQFVEAFYTTTLFKIERLLLGLFASRPSTDAEAKLLANGARSSFAAWRVEARSPSELLLRAGRTRSWLTTVQSSTSSHATQLMFGSAVVPDTPAAGGRSRFGITFAALLPFHKVYSRALLHSAKARLLGQRP